MGKSAAESMPPGSGSAYAVEVGAQADVINSRDLSDVIDVVDQRLQRRARDFGRPFPLDSIFIQIGHRFSGRLQFCEVGSTAASASFF